MGVYFGFEYPSVQGGISKTGNQCVCPADPMRSPESDQRAFVEWWQQQGIHLVVRPFAEQQIINSAAMDRAGGDEERAGWILRYTLYQFCNAELWGESLHIGESENELESTDTLLEMITQSPIRIPEKSSEYAKILISVFGNDNVLGHAHEYEWEVPLYLAFIDDFLGPSFTQTYMEHIQDREIQQGFQEMMKNGKQLYWGSAGFSPYEWHNETMQRRLTLLFNYMHQNLADETGHIIKPIPFSLKQNLEILCPIARMTGLVNERDGFIPSPGASFGYIPYEWFTHLANEN
jgi:hypothetical protein